MAEVREREDLSRVEATFGADLIGKLKKLKVYVKGLRGLGVETAKNLILTGPHTVMVHDDCPAEIADLGTNFYLTAASVGTPRGPATVGKLAELNPNVNVKAHTGAVSQEFFAQFQVIVITDTETPENLKTWNEWARAAGTVFLYGSILGMQASVFADYGPHFVCHDEDGEPLKTLIVDSISNSKNGIITIDGERHLLSDGDHIQIEEVKGMSDDAKADAKAEPKLFKLEDKVTDINQKFVVKSTKNPKQFLIGDTTGLGEYKSGGVINQLKVPVEFKHTSFEKQQLNPTFEAGYTDFMKFGREFQLHIARLALGQFHQEQKRLPRLHNEEDAAAVLAKAQAIVTANKKHVEEKKGDAIVVDSIDEKIIHFVSLYAAAENVALTSLFGGVLAQEVTKQTGKYRPITQWLHFDAFETLDEKVPGDAKAIGSRHDHQIALFGKALQDKLEKQNVFVVGCGALGCEYLKAIAMLGLGVKGRVSITDDDNIELSNLSRQFLFRRRHVGKSKAESAAEASIEMNDELKAALKVYKVRVETKSENTFTDEFWEAQTLVVNALDNMEARKYIDAKCVLYEKPLFESGTLGTKANTAICIPHKTPSYGEGVVAGEGQGIAKCTLRNFPSLPLHCIEWAREKFDDFFIVGADAANSLLEDRAGYFKKLKQSPLEERESLEQAKRWLALSKSPSYQTCVELAFEIFHKEFRDQINELTTNFPADSRNTRKTDDGQVLDLGPFWHGHKRFPHAHTFDAKDSAHVDFVYHTACIFANIFGLKDPTREEVVNIAKGLRPHEWRFSGKKTELDEDKKEKKEPEALGDDEAKTIAALTAELTALDLKGYKKLKPADFEKDDDSNHHIDVLLAATNLRSTNYHIKESNRASVRVIAGRIIPAIATTTAMITGFVQLEIIKYLKQAPLEAHRMASVNLATNTFCVELLPDPIKKKSGLDQATYMQVVAIPEGFTVWDRVDIKAPGCTLEQFIEQVARQHHDVKLDMLSTISKQTLYISSDAAAYERNKGRKLIELYEEATGGPIFPPGRSYVLFECSGENDAGDSVIIPTLKWIAK
jgi:ubiquitin-activating enzyme E1